MKLSIVIPTLNAGPLFREVLGALRHQDYADLTEILVVDSGSRDGTLAVACEFGAHTHAIAPEAFDHGATRNLGISMTRGDVVVLMTQDAVPADDHLLSGLAAPYADPVVGGVYARQIPRAEHDCLVRRNISRHIAGLPDPLTRQITDAAAFAALSPMERYRFCNFDDVCSSVRRSVWEQIPFTPTDFGEDLDWAKRALAAGHKIVYNPDARVIHSHSRPVGYEYRRTYQCHRKLHELFGVANVPALRYVPRAILHTIWTDSVYAYRHEPGFCHKLSLLTHIPALSIASVLGQYHGVRDRRRKAPVRHRDV